MVTYSVMCMCEFSLLLGWTLFKSMGASLTEGVPGLRLIRIYKRPCATLGGAAVMVVQDLVERRRIEIWI